MPQAKKEPQSPKNASINYAIDLVSRLKNKDKWRPDACTRLFKEYDRFVDMAIDKQFKVQSMWNYMRLVETTDGYLHDCASYQFSGFFSMKVREGLLIIQKQVQPSRLGAPEQESMRLAMDGMQHTMRWWWRVPERARE